MAAGEGGRGSEGKSRHGRGAIKGTVGNTSDKSDVVLAGMTYALCDLVVVSCDYHPAECLDIPLGKEDVVDLAPALPLREGTGRSWLHC